MIGKALNQIVTHLNSYLATKYPNGNVENYGAEIKNIQKPTDPLVSEPAIKVALINIEEDTVYKNHVNPIPGRLSNSINNIHPSGGIPTNRINLYVLFAFSPRSEQPTAYLNTLTLLTHVLTYFTSVSYQEIVIPPTTIAAIPPSTTPITIPEKRFNLEINYHNISLEDSNNMWSNLGGEQKPYAMYQIKMLELEADPTIPVVQSSVLQEALISSPDYDANGNTVFIDNIGNANHGKPANDTNEIKHKD